MPMFTFRTLRRRWFLAVIFGISLLYFMIKTFGQSDKVAVSEDYPINKPLRVPPEPFKWQPKLDTINASKLTTCRNSVQGRLLIADDRGYVCERKDLLSGGCCHKDGVTTKHYTCETCQDQGCCSLYEHCVSCCLQPEKQQLLRKILSQAVEGSLNQIFASVTDHFELCLTKCRTSSQSVQHENSYRDPKSKYCYGDKQPELQPPVAT